MIEGWEKAQFKDPVVDSVIGVSNYKDVLRRLRNGMFHYQPEIIPQKLTEFFKSSDAPLWLYFLHEEFCRWLRDHVEMVERSARLSPQQSQEWREDFAELVGWLPPRPAEEQLTALRKRCEEIEAELDASGSTSESAQDLRASLRAYDVAANQTAELVRQCRRNQLAKLGLNPDDYIP